MNKKLLKICIVLGIILIGILIFTLVNFKNDSGNLDNVETEILSEKINIKDKKVSYINATQEVNIVIPEFQNLEGEYIRYMNSKIYKEVSDANVYQSTISGYKEDEIGFFTYESDYERYNCGDYISIVVNQYIHLGYDRPRIQKKCYVIDVKRNASPVLMDMFEDKINYKQMVINEINKQAQEQDIELIGGNGLKELSDIQAFYIKDNKLVIYFEASEISATAVGQLEFTMPFKMLDGKFLIED